MVPEKLRLNPECATTVLNCQTILMEIASNHKLFFFEFTDFVRSPPNLITGG